MRVKARFITLLACTMALTTILGAGVAGADDIGEGTPAQMKPRFVTRCTFSHRLADDPIVYFNRPGVSHLHDFFGNRTTKASSTVKTMKKGTTTCKNPLDLSGYWTPSLRVDGALVNPTQASVYYSSNGKAFNKIKTPKKGLKIVAGSMAATSPQGMKITSWDCADDNTVPQSTHRADLPVGHAGVARELPGLLGRGAPRLPGPQEPHGVRRQGQGLPAHAPDPAAADPGERSLSHDGRSDRGARVGRPVLRPRGLLQRVGAVGAAPAREELHQRRHHLRRQGRKLRGTAVRGATGSPA